MTQMTEWRGVRTLPVPLTANVGIYAPEVGFSGSENGLFLAAHTVPEGELIGEIIPITSTDIIRKP